MFSVEQADAQINTYLRSIRPLTIVEQQPLSVSVELNQSSSLNRVTLFYRQFGQSEYRSEEMRLMIDSAVTEIPTSDVLPPFIELYIVATDVNGVTETLPFENPQVNPARIMVNTRPKIESEIIILSPDEGEQITEGETYISVSFVYADDKIDRARTKIILNGIDLSEKAVVFDDLLIVPPDAIPVEIIKGSVGLEIQTFDTLGNSLPSLRRGFNVITQRQAEEIEESFKGYGNAQIESRHENVKGTSKSYNRLDARAFGSYLNYLKANANLTLTSEEKPENQPQNRYFLGLDGKYAKVGLGDAYPRFPYTIMDGRRVRGITADLLLGYFNINAASGELLRRTEFNSAPTILKRNLTVVRPSFGRGENFQWGFTYSKAKDEFDPSQPITIKPQENVVFGSDMLVAFDNRRIEFTAQSALSLNNVDISQPEFNEDSIDAAIARGTFSKSDGDQLKSILPYLKIFITPNENLVPIDPTGQTSLVYETALAFNYFGNYLKTSYIYHGKDYNSAGATTIRKDIQGFNITDRLRLLDNRLFVTGSYERLQNNVSGFEQIKLPTGDSIEVTTTYNTVNASVTYYPSRDYPNFTFGYGLNSNSNPINPVPADTTPIEQQIALRAIDDKTNRFFLQSSYGFAYWGQHDLSLNLDISSKDDLTPKQQDVSTFNTTILVNTTHDLRMESSIGFSVSSVTFPQVDTAGLVVENSLGYQTISLTGRYKIYEDVLRLTGTVAPTFGDLSRFLFETGLQYSIASNQLASVQFQFIRNSSSALAALANKNDSYISFLYRIDF
ncbi:MAG: hypothetical protein HYV29_11520 [Ignavibacteriales bacterium]|nr:hypothetical protein [Ignavibacteriales bacterium]